MTKVICSKVGKHKMCEGCGAAKVHDGRDCEPCPLDKAIHCLEIKPAKDFQK